MNDVEQECYEVAPIESIRALAPSRSYTEITVSGTNKEVDGEDGVYGIEWGNSGCFCLFFPFPSASLRHTFEHTHMGPGVSRNVLYTHSLVVDMSIIAVRYRRSSFECLVESSGKFKG